MGKSIIGSVDNMIGGSRAVARIIGAAEDALKPAPAAAPTGSSLLHKLGAPKDVKDSVATVGGAAAGYYFFRKKHPLLGVIGGASLGRNLPSLLSADTRKMALRNLVTTGGGITGSLVFKSHPLLGFVGGLLVGGIGSHLAGLHE